MTQNTFAQLCEAAGIAPAIALENDALRAALAARNDTEVKRILATEF